MSCPSIDRGIRSIKFDGAVDCSNAVDDLGLLYKENLEWLWSASWQKVILKGSKVLGPHTAMVEAIVFNPSLRWTSKLSGNTFTIKCVLKCFTSDPSNRLSFVEFEHLFQVRNWKEANGKMIAVFESPNLLIE